MVDWKLEDKPFLLGFGNSSGASGYVKRLQTRQAIHVGTRFLNFLPFWGKKNLDQLPNLQLEMLLLSLWSLFVTMIPNLKMNIFHMSGI